MDRLRAIEYFVKVADLGSFSEAARATGVPASSISRRVRDLEAELGATLLHRTTRDVRLTELGTLYLEQIKPAIKDLDHAKELILDRPSAPTGVLRISAISGYGGFILSPAIKKLGKLYPELVVDLELSDELVDIAKNEVDIAVRATASPPERCVARKLTRNNFRLVASEAYLNKFGTPKSLADLRAHRAVIHRGPLGPGSWQAKDDGGWAEIQPTPGFVSNAPEELLSATIEGKGLALFPSWGIQQMLRDGTFVDVTPANVTMAITRSENSFIYLIYNRPKYRLNKIKATVDFLVSELQDETVKDL